MTVNPDLIKRSFSAVQPHGTEVTAWFYDHLFARHPEVRGLFAEHLGQQQDRLWAALGALVANLEDPAALTRILENLGRRHASYGALPEHYPAVGASLLATLEHFAGDTWTPETAASWAAVYGVVSSTMTGAAAGEPTPAA
ncbi:globin domain-containing protein [Streptacidiphilus sp. ASG 303]|uniref:globin domain-containing protein n=1 Tax=Streptacidiphilus sp. ASG 303 TaxID=2896847 RepID=UPI001E614303|nr:globin domain-containing protein [Streptacidiphilus sp. ASG 303]MCD0482356.1 globin domain-containing protein [Streptacidiphilus sp. ASG 303]